MAYVALSRVTSLSGLYLLDLDEMKIYANPEVTAVLQTMRQASVEEMMPLLQVQAPFPVLIGVVYRPPDYSLRPFMQNLPLGLELDPVSVPGFTSQPSHWFIQPEFRLAPPPLVCLDLLSRGQSQLSVFLSQLQLVFPSDVFGSGRHIRLQSVGRFLINMFGSLPSSGSCASSPD
ncbi:hypothetical protein CRENBAI_000248 [Crenichthys baileyi]|uniref:Uncharacterized protein n=1 Tax=Crenichthys baileyi TaxID=28760 RepID=A0AAV9S901_9TELE